MSYEEANSGKALRLGDVVRGFVLSAADVSLGSSSKLPTDYLIRIKTPKFAAILTPCCSIGDKAIALAPLEPVKAGYFKNPYWAEDFTRLNRLMTPQQAVSPHTWTQLSEEEKQRRLDGSPKGAYALLHVFVYSPHPSLLEYSLTHKKTKLTTGCYMIDFRNAVRVECKEVVNPKQAPLHTRILQLSRETRTELREKLAHYFGRTPLEDKY